MKVCSFTGHRKNLLPWKDENGKEYVEFVRRLECVIRDLAKQGYQKFISGMATGFDTIAAETVLALRAELNVKLQCAVPCVGQASRWSKADRDRYESILSRADEITYVTKSGFTPYCMNARNRYLVDNADCIVAFYLGIKGGTEYTVSYAKEKNKEIVFLNPEK